jgi:hypothetical protein
LREALPNGIGFQTTCNFGSAAVSDELRVSIFTAVEAATMYMVGFLIHFLINMRIYYLYRIPH